MLYRDAQIKNAITGLEEVYASLLTQFLATTNKQTKKNILKLMGEKRSLLRQLEAKI